MTLIPESERGKALEEKHANSKPAKGQTHKEILARAFAPGPEPHGNHGTAVIDPLAASPSKPTLAGRILDAFAKARDKEIARERKNAALKKFSRKDRDRLAREMRGQADHLERHID